MHRYLSEQVESDLKQKMVFIAGPRQIGKTTLAESIVKDSDRMLNWDDPGDREIILRREFPTTPGILVLDEIHKYALWRQLLKGLYDKRRKDLQILVTGSAKLDYYRRGGDSLQGRYHLLRMHPISVAELTHSSGKASKGAWSGLFRYGGFPEPFLSQSETKARRWSLEYRSRLIRDELTDLEHVKEISLLEALAQRLPECVGGGLSINSLREDLSISQPTAQRWVTLLERLYHIFRVSPYGPPRIKALKKEQKHYHYDWLQVPNPAARFENMVACHLLKWCHWMQDTQGFEMELRYYKDKEKREVDFVVLKDGKPSHLIECKWADASVSSHLRYLKQRVPQAEALQLTSPESPRDFMTGDGIRVCPADQFLKGLI